MKKLIMLTITTPILLASSAAAEPDRSVEKSADKDCPKVYRPKKKRPKKEPPKKTPPRVVHVDCDCEQGPPGPPGPEGPPGKPGKDGDPGKDASSARLSIAGGVMGALHLPHGDWAWGPALQIRHTDAKGLQVSFAAGLAAIAEGHVGNEDGLLLQLGLTKFGWTRDPSVGLGLGLHVTDINGSASNGDVDGRYIGLDAHIAVQRPVSDLLDLRFEVGPVLSYLRDDVEGKQLGVGIQSSLFLGGDL